MGISFAMNEYVEYFQVYMIASGRHVKAFIAMRVCALKWEPSAAFAQH